MSAIPVIDLAQPRAAVVAALRDALENIGFLQVVNHGVDLAMVGRTYAAKEALIGLPEDDKRAMISESHPFRGWKRVLDPAGTIIQERFQVCNFDDPVAAAQAGVDAPWLDYFHPNIWPPIDGFKTDVRAWFDATRDLGARLMSLFALALDLEPDFFVPGFQHDVTCFAVNVYPGVATSATSAEPRVVLPAHADSGTLTVLHQRGDYAGLQVQTASGAWLTVPVLEDAFVINVGELMARWTNDRWNGTRHRVVAPPESGMARTSLTTFYLPSADTRIAPLPTCVGSGGPHYAPVTAYEWERAYLSKQYRRVGTRYVTKAA
jgi:isopenicillin N synthase-like dioxygenase